MSSKIYDSCTFIKNHNQNEHFNKVKVNIIFVKIGSWAPLARPFGSIYWFRQIYLKTLLTKFSVLVTLAIFWIRRDRDVRTDKGMDTHMDRQPFSENIILDELDVTKSRDFFTT